MGNIFSTIFYIPFYNAFVFIIGIIPGHSAGVRLILYPLSKQSIKTQLKMKQIEPEIAKLRTNVKDKQEQAKQMMQLYKERDIHPFSGILLLFIQLPILLGMYQVFRSGLPKLNASIIYSFIHAPAAVSMTFLGLSLLGTSYILALFASFTQFIQFQLALPTPPKTDKRTFQTDLATSMNMQMKYVYPIILFFIAVISPVIALYFVTSNTFMILQEVFVRRRMAKKYTTTTT
jgi:YidC/Oxa1 family membrane protein insertase